MAGPAAVPATEFAEIMKFRFGADVQADDGEAGKVAFVIADAERRAVTHIGVRLSGLFASTYVLTLDYITTATADSVTLTIPLSEIAQHDTNPFGIKLSAATPLMAGGKGLGKLAQVTIHNDTHELRHLVVERGMGHGEYLVRAQMIAALTAKGIELNMGEVKPNQLTPFRADATLQQVAREAIYNYPRLRVDMPGIDIHVIDGVMWLRGHVASELNRRLVTDQLEGIVGIAELHNELVADNELAAEVSMALARDPRTAGQHIGVYPRLGEVRLRGGVHTADAIAAAENIAHATPGTKVVTNELHLNPRATVIPVLAGVTNNEEEVPG